MDSYRELPNDFDPPSPGEIEASNDVAAAIGTDERRMHVRAYNYWVALLNGRDFPSIEDLEPSEVEDFAPNSVLLDFTCGRDNPALPYVGATVREECGLDDDMRTIADVPSRSLLSRLTDHYMQIIANRAPVGFEAEFENQREETICYRGILMPFSSDGDVIDFIYGVINWKRVGEDDEPAAPQSAAPAADDQPIAIEIEGIADEPELPATIEPAHEEEDFLELTDFVEPPVHAGGAQANELEAEQEAGSYEPEADPEPQGYEPQDEPDVDPEPQGEVADAPAPVHFSWEDGPLHDEDEVPVVQLDEDAGLADRLWAARETAESVKAGEGRTRAALYKALSLAYDFAVAAQQNPEEYAELLEESGVKAQARAPMTPIVKLVFGVDYDKARLTEFAAALSYAQRQEVGFGEFQALIERQPGGLKALVAAERQARRPEPKADSKSEVARARLRSAAPISLADVPAEEEFAVVVTRRGPDGTHEPVAIVDDEALIERAIRRAL
jgi:hypothetical protein